MLQSKSLSQLRKVKRVKGRSLVPSRRTTVDNTTFDSVAESKYYEKLKSLDTEWEVYHQPKVEMMPGITWNLDFLIIDGDSYVFVDVKGMRVTREAALKIKIWEAIGTYQLQVQKRDTHSGVFLVPKIFNPVKNSKFPTIILDRGKLL